MLFQCPNCGNPVPPDSHTCPYCRHRLREATGSPLASCVMVALGVVGFAIAMSLIHSGVWTWTILGIAIIAGLSIWGNSQR